MKKHYFSLIELLVVIGIIAILAGLAFPAYSTIQGRSRENAAVAGCNSLAMAIKQFETTYSKFPAVTLTDKTPVGGKNSQTTVYDDILGILTGIQAGSTTDYTSWTDKNARKIKFLDPSSEYMKTSYVNPWKERYYIYWNLDGSNKIEFKRPANGTLTSNTITLLSDVAVFCELDPHGKYYKTGSRLATSWGGMKDF